MEDIITQLVSSGPVGIVCAAVVYIIIAVQRNSTKKSRDDDHDKIVTRIALLEEKMKKIEELDLAGKLAAIQVDLSWIKQKMMEKK
jgi:hypothetical protein